MAYPRLLLEPKSAALCEQCLERNPMEILRFLLEFIHHSLAESGEASAAAAAAASTSLSTKGAKRKLSVNLIDGIKQEDFGIASGLLQMHLTAILGHCLSPVPGVQGAAFDIVCLALEQGLVHPLLCIPTVIAMQAFPRASLTAKAAAVHGRVVEKHPSFIHSRNLDGLRLLHQARVALGAVAARGAGQPQQPPMRADGDCLTSFFAVIRGRRALKYETFLSILDAFELKEEEAEEAAGEKGKGIRHSQLLLSPRTPGPGPVQDAPTAPHPGAVPAPSVGGGHTRRFASRPCSPARSCSPPPSLSSPLHAHACHTQAKAAFCVFLARNLAGFPFKYQEEVTFLLVHALRLVGALGSGVRERLTAVPPAGWHVLVQQDPGLLGRELGE
jgi:hypothetical protein